MATRMELPRQSALLSCLLPLLLSLLCLCSAAGGVEVTWTLAQAPGNLQDLVHPCQRTCQEGDQRICHYNFTVEHYSTMGEACGSCPFVRSDCSLPGCVAADGVKRKVVTVNRRIPGPTIHVCQWDEVVVDVHNELVNEDTTIHWHGIHQHGTPYMDGVPYLTQCPITPGTNFRYQFTAREPGTHYWHSHSGFQRTDGVFGSLVVHQTASTDPHAHLYDTDLPQHLLVLSDWLKDLSAILYHNMHLAPDEDKPHTILVNGKGAYLPFLRSEEEAFTPLHEVTVTPGARHRFRVMSNSVRNCPVVVSVDGHNLLAIATDGHPLEPVEVESFTIHGGERWDFVLTADKDVGAYWIKFQGVMHCGTRHKSAYQVAVLRYDGAKGMPGNVKEVTYHSTIRKGHPINSVEEGPGEHSLLAAEVRSLTPAKDDIAGTPDHTFYLSFDFYMNKTAAHIMVQMNGISFDLPNAPPLSQPESVDQSLFCNAESHSHCGVGEAYCRCTHVLDVGMGSLVEVVLVDQSYVPHPFHIHGLSFYVVAMGVMGDEASVEKLKELDAAGEVQRNFERAPWKDTVTVPSGGYVVIRFPAHNPGYWLFHCHLSFHVEMGMSLVFHVGDDSMLPPVPEGFLRCDTRLTDTSRKLMASLFSCSFSPALN